MRIAVELFSPIILIVDATLTPLEINEPRSKSNSGSAVPIPTFDKV